MAGGAVRFPQPFRLLTGLQPGMYGVAHPTANPTPDLLPSLATPPRPKTSPILAGFYQKP